MAKNVALVLGGGGSAGHAWTIGVIAGLAEAGIDMTEAADLVIGTSSGATAAAQVRSGIPPAELLASILSEPVPPVGQNRPTPPGSPMATVFERMKAIGAAAISAADLQRAMGAFGLECGCLVRGERWDWWEVFEGGCAGAVEGYLVVEVGRSRWQITRK